MLRCAAIVALVLSHLGCEPKGSGSDPAPLPSTGSSGASVSDAGAQASPPPTGTPKPATPPGGDPCADIRARFNAVHAARTDTCTSASDCACFNPVGGPSLGCGGVTDAITAAKLAEIEKEFHAASCQWTHQCAAWACAPRCVAGRCSM